MWTCTGCKAAARWLRRSSTNNGRDSFIHCYSMATAAPKSRKGDLIPPDVSNHGYLDFSHECKPQTMPFCGTADTEQGFLPSPSPPLPHQTTNHTAAVRFEVFNHGVCRTKLRQSGFCTGHLKLLCGSIVFYSTQRPKKERKML